jgi:pyruvate dehydrogenase E1 component beta subunit
MAKKNFTYAWMEGLAQEMRKNPKLITIWQNSVPVATLPTGELIDLRKEFGELRTWAAPIDEMTQNYSGAGAALAGVPVMAQTPNMTSLFSVEPIFNQISKLRSMTGGQATIPLVLQIQGASRIEGRAAQHNEVGAEAVYAFFPGLYVLCPSDAYDAKGLMIAALHSPDPVIYLNMTEASATAAVEVPDEMYETKIGKAKIRQEGKDLTIIAWAPAILDVLKALDGIKKAGIAADVIDLITIKPLDTAAIIASAKKTGRVLVVDHAPYTQSFSSHVIAEIAQFVPGVKVRKIAFPDAPGPAAKEMVLWMRPDAPKIVDAAQKMMKL